MQLTNIIGTKVYSIYDCKEIGYVLNAIYNKKMTKITSFLIANDEDELEYTLKAQNIFSFGSNCVLIKNSTKVEITTAEAQNIRNCTMLDFSGEVDKLKDIIFNEKYEVEAFVGNDFKITPAQIITIKNNTFLTNRNNLEFKRRQFRPRKRVNDIITKQTQNVKILENNISKPQTIIGNNLNVIVGKRLSENLYSKQNQILGYKNSIITYNLIDIAKQLDIVDSLVKLAK